MDINFILPGNMEIGQPKVFDHRFLRFNWENLNLICLVSFAHFVKNTRITRWIGRNTLKCAKFHDSLIKNINLIAKYIKKEAPGTKLYIQSILPVSDHYMKFSGHTKNNAIIVQVNQVLAGNATNLGYTYIDLHSKFLDKDGKLRNDLSNDGLHLVGDGYQLWKHLVYHHVYDLEEKPSLIPLPQKTIWNGNIFTLYKCTNI